MTIQYKTSSKNERYVMREDVYMSFASFLANWTCESRWLRSVICVLCAPFFPDVVVGAAGAIAVWDSDIRASSPAKPGIRMLWFRSEERDEHWYTGSRGGYMRT